MLKSSTLGARAPSQGLVAMRGGAATPAPKAPERRQFGRRPSRITAEVRYRRNCFTCAVLDVSEGGAFLALDDAALLPARVMLALPEHGIEIMVDVRHRAKEGVGVQFMRGDIARFRDQFCRPTAATSTPAIPLAPLQRPAMPAGARSTVDLRRALFAVVDGGIAVAQAVVSRIPLSLRREAGRAVVVSAAMLIASRRLADGASRAEALVPFAEVGSG